MTLAFFLDHFWHFFFWGPGQPVWYERAVRGNVMAVLPLAVLGAIGFWWHHRVLKRLHATHDRHLRMILDVLDPQTDGGMAIVLDRLDETTPSGIGAVIALLGKHPKP